MTKMREKFDLPKDFPTAKQLEKETYDAFLFFGRDISNKEIKKYISKKLHLSKETLLFENSDGFTRLLDYRLCWIRTVLKNKGIIVNKGRAIWGLSDDYSINKNNK